MIFAFQSDTLRLLMKRASRLRELCDARDHSKRANSVARSRSVLFVVTLRDVVSDDDLEAWRQIRLAIMPYERTATVAELRGMERPGRQLILAELDGVAVGHGFIDRSDLAG